MYIFGLYLFPELEYSAAYLTSSSGCLIASKMECSQKWAHPVPPTNLLIPGNGNSTLPVAQAASVGVHLDFLYSLLLPYIQRWVQNLLLPSKYIQNALTFYYYLSLYNILPSLYHLVYRLLPLVKENLHEGKEFLFTLYTNSLCFKQSLVHNRYLNKYLLSEGINSYWMDKETETNRNC